MCVGSNVQLASCACSGGVWLVPAMKNWYEVFDGTAKHTLGGGEIGVGVGGVTVLFDGTLEGVCVKAPMCICIVSNETLHGLHPYFCLTIGVWESHGGESVMDAPFPQECAGGTRCEFRPTVGGAFVWDDTLSSKGVHQAFGPLVRSFDDWPVGVLVDHNEVVHSFVGEEVRTDALKGVGRWDWWVGGCAWL